MATICCDSTSSGLRGYRLGFDPRLVHRAGDGGARHEVASELRDDDPAAGGADRVPGATDALHAAGNRRWRLDLHHQVDGSHVDAELE